MPELNHRRRLLVLAICCSSLLVVSLDNTILNVALPSLQRDFGSSLSGLQWTIDAYLIVLASLLILSGSTADRIGRRRVFQTGLALFVAGSVLCSLAPSLGWLVGARVVQAVGGSMLTPVAMSIITNVFTDPRERAAPSARGAVVGLSMAMGPLVGGLLVDSVGWRSIFWLNVPIGLAALALTALFVPESRAERPVGRPGRAGVPDRAARHADPRDHRGARPRPRRPGRLRRRDPRRRVPRRVRPARAARPEPLIDLRFFHSLPFSGATLIAVVASRRSAGSCS